MALIKCPECGREKVSDSAEMCPDCGYGIKTHFDRIKEEKKRRQAQIDRIAAHKQRIKNVPRPQKPVFSKAFTIYIIVVISLSFILCIIEPIVTNDNNINFLGFCLEILFWIGLPLAVYGHDFKKRLDTYHLAQRDFEEYQKQMAKEQEQTQAIIDMQASAHARKLANRPKCPYCSSKNTIKITTTQKVINVALFGVFGQKRKHYWHCNNCNSDF